jgi:hypothetical protein
MRAAALQRRLGLSDDELLAVLDEDALTVITDDLDHRPEVPLLLQLTAGPAERLGEDRFTRWVRAKGPKGRPLDHLLARDFGAFEDALATLADRGFVLRGGG